jgi:hypothetical protein
MERQERQERQERAVSKATDIYNHQRPYGGYSNGQAQ